jgi:hypothetical protein
MQSGELRMKFQHKWSMGFFAFLTWFSLNTTFAAIDTCRVHAVVKNGINGRDGVEATLVFQLQKLSLKVNQPWSVIQESENLANILQVQQDKLEQQICVLPNVYHMHLFSKDFVEFEQAYDAFIYQNPIEFDTLPHLTASSFSRNRLPNWHEMFPLPVQRKKEILAIFLNYWSTQAQGELSANTKDKTPTLEELKLLESNLGFLFDIFSSIQGMQGEREFALTLEKNLNFDLNAWNLPIEEGHDLNQPGHIILKLSRSLIKKALRNTAESNIKKSYHYMEALNPRTLAGELEIYKKFCFTKYIDNEGNLHVEKPSFFQMYYLTFKKPLKYCVYIDPLSTSSTVLYHMGGAGSYAEDPEQVPFYDLRNKIRGNKFSLPHVISMSLGKRESLMIPHRVEYFVEKWSKVMEEDLQTLVRKLSGRNQRHFERFAIGISLRLKAFIATSKRVARFRTSPSQRCSCRKLNSEIIAIFSIASIL